MKWSFKVDFVMFWGGWGLCVCGGFWGIWWSCLMVVVVVWRFVLWWVWFVWDFFFDCGWLWVIVCVGFLWWCLLFLVLIWLLSVWLEFFSVGCMLVCDCEICVCVKFNLFIKLLFLWSSYFIRRFGGRKKFKSLFGN